MTENRIFSGKGDLVAAIFRITDAGEGVNFLSDPDDPLQLAVSTYEAGTSVQNHIHNRREISIDRIQEIVHIDSGKAEIDLFDDEKEFITTERLASGDTIFFISGGHGIRFEDKTTIIEVKQGPYKGKEIDKSLF